MSVRNSYMYGNAAPKLPQRPERTSRPRPAEPARRETALPRQVSPSYANVPKAKLYFCMIMIIIMAFAVLHRFSVLADMNTAMGRMTDELNDLINANRLIKVDIETSINLDAVKRIAQDEYGMHVPDRSQIVPVKVPKNNYSVVLDRQYIEKAGAPEKTLLESVAEAISAAFP